MAVDAGFEGIEIDAGRVAGALDEVAEAAERTGLMVHSVHDFANWRLPLSSADPTELAAGIRATLTCLEIARTLGAGTMLLVPGRVGASTSYSQAYTRSQWVIRNEILPAAAEMGIVLGVENVWNGFLLGPLEYARYIDEFESPWVRAYLDLGNVIFGHCEDWIEIVGVRTVALHLKDFTFDERSGRFGARKIGEGQIDWARVRAALARTGFSGWGTFAQAELAEDLLPRKAYNLCARNMPAPLRAVPGLAVARRAAQYWLRRRLLDDVMTRCRRHVM